MIDFDSTNFHSSIRLADGLRINLKDELRDIAKLLRISVPFKLRKNEYIETLVDKVLADPEAWLSRLSRNELILLRKLVDAGPEAYVEETDFLYESTLEYLDFIFIDRFTPLEYERVRYMICDEVRESIAPHLDKVLAKGEQTFYFVVEQYAHGLLNLYGFLRYSVLDKMLCEYLHNLVPEAKIAEALALSMLIQNNTFDMVTKHGTDVYVKSPTLLEPDKLERDLYQRREIKELKRYSKEEVFAMGKMPGFEIPCDSSDALKKYMIKRLDVSEELAISYMQSLWHSMQIGVDPISVSASIIKDKLPAEKDFRKALELFVDFCNQSPRWFLKGHSAVEIAALLSRGELNNIPPRLTAGPGMRALDMDITPDIQSEFDNMFYKSFFGAKVGRNDPCPCGSGKKYKNCCGRRDN